MRLVPDNLRNLYFRRLFMSYAVVAIAIGCLSGSFIYNKARQLGGEESVREAQSRLNELRTFVGSTYLERYKSAFINDMLSSADSTGSAHHIFYDQYDPNVYQIFRVVNHLKAMVAANPGTESVSLYFPNMRFVVDPYTFFKITDAYPDAALIRSVMDDRGLLDRWLPRVKSYGEGVGEQIMTYVYAFPSGSGGAPEAYMLIDMPIAGMKALLDSRLSSPQEKLFLYDRERGFAIGSSNVTDRELALFRDSLELRGDGSADVSGVPVRFASSEGRPDSWLYASARPSDGFSSPLGSLQKQILLVYAITLAIGLIGSYYLTVHTYRPMRSMLYKLRSLYGSGLPAQPRNEFHVFDHILNGVTAKMNHLKGQLYESKLPALLTGQLAADEWLEPIPPDARFAVAHIRTEAGCAKELLSAIRRLPSPVARLAAEKTAEQISVLYYWTEQGYAASHIRAELERLAAEWGRERTFAAGVGSLAESVEDIAKSNEHAALALQYSFLMDDAAIIGYADIQDRSELPAIHYEPFDHALRSGDEAAIGQFLDEFAETLLKDRIAIEAAELALMQLMMILSKVMVDMNAKENMFSVRLPFRDFRRSTFRETVACIREQSEQTARHIHHYLQSRTQHELIYKLKRYIDSHLHETISLDTLSAMAGLSTQYLSKQFKDILNVPFIEYLTNARLERARELLQATGLSVTTISAQVGYSNLQYFSSRFKHKYGVTPSQYRSSLSREPGRPAEAGE